MIHQVTIDLLFAIHPIISSGPSVLFNFSVNFVKNQIMVKITYNVYNSLCFYFLNTNDAKHVTTQYTQYNQWLIIFFFNKLYEYDSCKRLHFIFLFLFWYVINVIKIEPLKIFIVALTKKQWKKTIVKTLFSEFLSNHYKIFFKKRGKYSNNMSLCFTYL